MNWWEKNLPHRMDEFVGWLGGPGAPSRVRARELIRERDPKSVLEVACGPAIEAGEWPGIEWRGVDSCQYLVDYAAEKGLAVSLGDAEKLPFKAGEFDVVYSRHLWEHLPTFKKALREALRVASKAVVHVFFRPPGAEEHLGWVDEWHENTYRRADIEAAIGGHPYSWHDVGNEVVLVIDKANKYLDYRPVVASRSL
jgi:ubiquinone/menaquinone biosynthesis C-methylase UbiE